MSATKRFGERVNGLLSGAAAVAALAVAGTVATGIQSATDKWWQLVVVAVLAVASAGVVRVVVDSDSVPGLVLKAVGVGAVLGWLLGWVGVSAVTVLFVAGAVVVVLSVLRALFGDLPGGVSWFLTAVTVGLVGLKGASVAAWLGVAGVGGLSLLGLVVAVLVAVRVRAVVSRSVPSSVEDALSGGWSGVLSV